MGDEQGMDITERNRRHRQAAPGQGWNLSRVDSRSRARPLDLLRLAMRRGGLGDIETGGRGVAPSDLVAPVWRTVWSPGSRMYIVQRRSRHGQLKDTLSPTRCRKTVADAVVTQFCWTLSVPLSQDGMSVGPWKYRQSEPGCNSPVLVAACVTAHNLSWSRLF